MFLRLSEREREREKKERGRKNEDDYLTLPKPSCSSGHRGNGRVVGCISKFANCGTIIQEDLIMTREES